MSDFSEHAVADGSVDADGRDEVDGSVEADRSDRGRPVEPVSQSVLDTVIEPGSVVEQVSVDSPPMVRTVLGGRHESRERAVHLLYEGKMKSLSAARVIESQVLLPDPYTLELVNGVEAAKGQLDELIGRLARGWSLERMPTMDLVILQLGVYELAHQPEVPRGVVLAEAVDFASQYGTDDSAKFVNGLLAAAANELRPA